MRTIKLPHDTVVSLIQELSFKHDELIAKYVNQFPIHQAIQIADALHTRVN